MDTDTAISFLGMLFFFVTEDITILAWFNYYSLWCIVLKVKVTNRVFGLRGHSILDEVLHHEFIWWILVEWLCSPSPY